MNKNEMRQYSNNSAETDTVEHYRDTSLKHCRLGQLDKYHSGVTGMAIIRP